jgi:hypothetical protein
MTTEHVPYADPFDPDMLADTTFTLTQIARARHWDLSPARTSLTRPSPTRPPARRLGTRQTTA